MATYATRAELDGAIDAAIRSLLVTPPTGGTLTTLIDTVRTAAAYTDHTGATQYSPASITAAVHTAAQASGLLLRDGFLMDLLARVEQLELV